MPVNISYIAEENLLNLIFQGNLDAGLSRDISSICRNLSSCVKSCILDLSAVDHLFDSGVALLQVLYLRLSELGIEVLILGEHPDIRGQIAPITGTTSNPSPAGTLVSYFRPRLSSRG